MHRSLTSWHLAPERVALGEREVHIWRTSLQRTPEERARLQRFLTPDELERARSFSSREHAARWIVARGVLRVLLGTYLETHPARLRFRYDEHGKPSLAGLDLHFNLSHSADLAAYAFARTRRLGLDIEWMRPAFAATRLARRKFAPGEYEVLQALPADEQRRAFFTCWTRKEAYIKAHGKGIAYGLGSFEVSLRPGERAEVLKDRLDPGAGERWSMQDVAFGEGYAGALVIERAERPLDEQYYELPGGIEFIAAHTRGKA